MVEKLKEKVSVSKNLMPEAKACLQSWLDGGFLPEWGLASLSELLEDQCWDELNNRFFGLLKFGTGGMRGRTIGGVVTRSERGNGTQKSPQYPGIGSSYLNDFNVIRATLGLYQYSESYLKTKSIKNKPRLVVAHDVRHFSRHFSELIGHVWTLCGGEMFLYDGPRSTPQLSFSVRHLNATAGIVITASHNPPHDNGYKVYFSDGGQVVPPHDQGIIDVIREISLNQVKDFLDKDISRIQMIGREMDEIYVKALDENVLQPDLMKNFVPHVVYTGLHGTGNVLVPSVLRRAGVRVDEVEKQAVMDPDFSTVDSPNPENGAALTKGIELAKALKADAVLGTDPDCDRMGAAVIDSWGDYRLYTGNQIGSMLAEYRIQKLKEKKILSEEGASSARLIKTFVTTPLQEKIALENGLKCVDTLTGFKWIGRKLYNYEKQLLSSEVFKKSGLNYHDLSYEDRAHWQLKCGCFYVFGGEESYGYLATDKVRDKDANAVSLIFCELLAYLKSQGLSVEDYLDSLYLKYGYHLEGLMNFYYEGAEGAEKIKKLLSSYRDSPPQKVGDLEVATFLDFGRDEIHDCDGETVPRQDFYFMKLKDGLRIAVRGSGTEPKVKYYLFAEESVSDKASLDVSKQNLSKRLDSLKELIRQDAEERSN